MSVRSFGPLWLVGAAFFWAPTGDAAAQWMPEHIVRTGSATFEASPDEVFAVLSPDGQQSLSRSWTIEILWPADGSAQVGATFRKKHRRASVEQIWTVTAAEAPSRITYAIFVADLESWVFEIELRPEQGGTRVQATHSITSLSENADPDVRQFADTFDAYFETWCSAIRQAVAAGRGSAS